MRTATGLLLGMFVLAAAGTGCCPRQYQLSIVNPAEAASRGYPLQVDVIFAKNAEDADKLEKAKIEEWFAKDAVKRWNPRPTVLTFNHGKAETKTVMLNVRGDDPVEVRGTEDKERKMGDLKAEEIYAVYIFAYYRGGTDANSKLKIDAAKFWCREPKVFYFPLQKIDVELGKDRIIDPNIKKVTGDAGGDRL